MNTGNIKNIMIYVALFLIVALIALCFVFLPWVILNSKQRTDKADALAASMGCVNLGSAKYIDSVKFFDCNGEIRLVKVE